MSKTPRTDAFVLAAVGLQVVDCVDFARSLERENVALREALANLVAVEQREGHVEFSVAFDEARAILAALAPTAPAKDETDR